MLGFGSRSKKNTRNVYPRETRSRSESVRRNTDRAEEHGRNWGQWLRWIIGLSIAVCLLLGLVVGMFLAHRMAVSSDFFAIKRVEIRGNTHYKRDDILKASGLQQGVNSLQINIADIKKAIAQNPWVQKVAVKRNLPDGFEIHIEEKIPAFWMLNEGVLKYIDSKGEVIAPVEADNFLSLPTLKILPGGEPLLPQVQLLVAQLRRAKLPLDMASVSWVRVSAAKGFELFLENRNLTLCIAAEKWGGNIEKLGMVLGDLARRGELKHVREVWASEASVWVVRSQEEN